MFIQSGLFSQIQLLSQKCVDWPKYYHLPLGHHLAGWLYEFSHLFPWHAVGTWRNDSSWLLAGCPSFRSCFTHTVNMMLIFSKKKKRIKSWLYSSHQFYYISLAVYSTGLCVSTKLSSSSNYVPFVLFSWNAFLYGSFPWTFPLSVFLNYLHPNV